jgi:hypothetical protein
VLALFKVVDNPEKTAEAAEDVALPCVRSKRNFSFVCKKGERKQNFILSDQINKYFKGISRVNKNLHHFVQIFYAKRIYFLGFLMAWQ